MTVRDLLSHYIGFLVKIYKGYELIYYGSPYSVELRLKLCAVDTFWLFQEDPDNSLIINIKEIPND